MRVLMVSESAMERLRATAALRARPGIRVDEAGSPAEAHRMTQDEDYDALIIDGDMRPEGGFSLLYELRAHGQQVGAPVPPAIMLMAREDDRWMARWAGASEALVKPVDFFFLAKRVEALAREPEAWIPVETAGQTSMRGMAMDRPPELTYDRAPELSEAPDE